MTMRRWLILVILTPAHAQLAALLSQPCPNLCSGHGWCDSGDRRCRCYAGYQAADCTERVCPAGPAWADHADALMVSDVAHLEAECSNRGICERARGACVCVDGFTGAACERKACPNDCNGQGKCTSLEDYATQVDLGQGLTSYIFETGGSMPTRPLSTGLWDAEQMYGCVCDDGYFGYDCLKRTCPAGDDPLPSSATTYNVQRMTCTADGGSFYLSFKGHFTEALSFGATPAALEAALNALPSIMTPPSQDWSQGVSIETSSRVLCDKDGTQVEIKFLQDYGELPLLLANVQQLTLSTGSASRIKLEKTQIGTKQSLECSGRGTCDNELGTCLCDVSCAEGCFSTSDGYGNPGGRGDCGYRDGTVTGETIMPSCPGEVPCNDRGICDDETFSCTCIDGFTGADCTLMTCPKGRSWFSAPVNEADDVHLQLTECGSMGYCNRDYGECECAPGFEGAACQYMKCPGADVGGACFEQGECLSLSFLANAALDNGVATSTTYGKTPNDKYRWDFESIRGCKCNRDRTHWDCSQKLCPFGDDPLSTSQYNELQNLNCDLDDDTTATVRFTFREETTDALDPTTMTLRDLEEALEALETIDDVRLKSSIVGGDDDAQFVCSNSRTDTLVEFLRPTGDVPLLQVSDGGTFTVAPYREGTKEWEECSGRGLCDRATGLCTCFAGYGASDGQGGGGPHEDCGRPIPLVLGMAQLAGNTE